MMPLVATERVIPNASTSAVKGRVRLQWIKTVWLLIHGAAGMAGIILFTRIDTVLLFLALTAITICAGHSVGMHRLLIHRSFKTYRGIELLLVWLGTLVGMAGPFGMIRAHDMRDWHQRQTVCPPHPSHDATLLKDGYWQLCCTYELEHPPVLEIESNVYNDRIYRLMERTWMAQQIPIAAILFLAGGWAWVLWGCSLRIFVSLVGHWLVGHFAHRKGHQDWVVDDLPVQGYNLPNLGLITFGENWHGNHHAFPHSAQLGLKSNQPDPGFALIMALQRLSLAWEVKLPQSEPPRLGLRRTT